MDFSLIDCASTGNHYPAQKPPTRTVNVHAVLFFDGTLNNERNTRERVLAEGGHPADAYFRHGQGDTSYANDYTNVALLKRFANMAQSPSGTIRLNTYIEGIGTTELQGDDMTGYAFGKGKTGIVGKAQRGLKLLEADLVSIGKIHGAQSLHLRIDVIGFSRGAAAARHFIYAASNSQSQDAVNESRSLSLKDRLRRNNLWLEAMEFGFVGLFDTVASFGFEGTAEEISSTRALHLDAIAAAKNIFQIAATDEHRVNFALTDISSAGSKGRQISLPGVHCDIGGSYLDYATERFSILNISTAPMTNWVLSFVKSDLEHWIREGWFTWSDVEHRAAPGGLRPGDSIRDAIQSNRRVIVFRAGKMNHGLRNKYSLVALHLMRHQATQCDICFLPSIHRHSLTTLDATCPPIIKEAFNLALLATSENRASVIFPATMLYELRRNYFHCSANYDKSFDAFAPRFIGTTRSRRIHKG